MSITGIGLLWIAGSVRAQENKALDAYLELKFFGTVNQIEPFWTSKYFSDYPDYLLFTECSIMRDPSSLDGRKISVQTTFDNRLLLVCINTRDRTGFTLPVQISEEKLNRFRTAIKGGLEERSVTFYESRYRVSGISGLPIFSIAGSYEGNVETEGFFEKSAKIKLVHPEGVILSSAFNFSVSGRNNKQNQMRIDSFSFPSRIRLSECAVNSFSPWYSSCRALMSEYQKEKKALSDRLAENYDAKLETHLARVKAWIKGGVFEPDWSFVFDRKFMHPKDIGTGVDTRRCKIDVESRTPGWENAISPWTEESAQAWVQLMAGYGVKNLDLLMEDLSPLR